MPDKPTLNALLATLPDDVAERLREWMPSGVRLTAARARLGQFRARMRLDTLGTGTWRAKDISGEKIHIEMKADTVAFEKSRVQLHLDVELNIQVPSLRKPKVYKLGPVHESVVTPTLPRIQLSSSAEELSASFVLSSVRADEVTADVEPIRDVDSGTVTVEGIEVEQFVAPSDGFGLPGLRVGPMTVESAGVEAGSATKSRAARVSVATEAKASDVVLNGATIVGGRAMAAEGDDLNLDFEVQLPAMTIKTFPSMPDAIERLVTRLSMRIEPKVVFQIGKLKLEGVTLTTRVGTLRIGSLSLPIDVKGSELEEIELAGMSVESVAVQEEASASSEDE